MPRVMSSVLAISRSNAYGIRGIIVASSPSWAPHRVAVMSPHVKPSQVTQSALTHSSVPPTWNINVKDSKDPRTLLENKSRNGSRRAVSRHVVLLAGTFALAAEAGAAQQHEFAGVDAALQSTTMRTDHGMFSLVVISLIKVPSKISRATGTTILFTPGGPSGLGVGFDPRGVSRTAPPIVVFEDQVEDATWRGISARWRTLRRTRRLTPCHGCVVDSENYRPRLWSNNLLDADLALHTILDGCIAAGPLNCALYESTTEKVHARPTAIFDSLKKQPLPVYRNETRKDSRTATGHRADAYLMSCTYAGDPRPPVIATPDALTAIACMDTDAPRAADTAEDLEEHLVQMREHSEFAEQWPLRVLCT
ncbi:uncharacterized protein PHACADRAFT_201510 [Phanerochaete carnosa HHB-10118-sp]|uniref:Uncharacterized protein n=1 Tax=Phanerochaete carnosa (strain HHB-10118-sp) TaxID=650164 RepID=K5VTE3_PHACS|nr:uncharacterized protein PHACADRAFT_201510 [Phanerochaete carnosa HHB-10118-sp]EKM49809.1 hypothetical protein PHACADRAFT_201510 [Phanerochaete carnosa HHB-10118-sp]